MESVISTAVMMSSWLHFFSQWPFPKTNLLHLAANQRVKLKYKTTALICALYMSLSLFLNVITLQFTDRSKDASVLPDKCVTHLCMNSMILSLLRRCGSVYFSSPFWKYLTVGKPEILKRSPTALLTVVSTAANAPGLYEEKTIANRKSSGR